MSLDLPPDIAGKEIEHPSQACVDKFLSRDEPPLGVPLGQRFWRATEQLCQQTVVIDFQKRKGGALGRILIDLGYIKESDLNIALAAQKGYELVNLEGVNIPPIAINAVPQQIAATNKVLPISFDPSTKKLTVVMANHENFRALDDLRSLMGYHVTAMGLSASPAQIKRSPTLGEHTDEVLREVLGYDGARVDQLKAAGAFSLPKKK